MPVDGSAVGTLFRVHKSFLPSFDLHERSTRHARAVDSSRRARESPRVASVARASARPIEGERSVRLSVCVRVPYPKAVPIGTSIVKRRTHESVWMQTRCWLAG